MKDNKLLKLQAEAAKRHGTKINAVVFFQILKNPVPIRKPEISFEEKQLKAKEIAARLDKWIG